MTRVLIDDTEEVYSTLFIEIVALMLSNEET